MNDPDAPPVPISPEAFGDDLPAHLGPDDRTRLIEVDEGWHRPEPDHAAAEPKAPAADRRTREDQPASPGDAAPTAGTDYEPAAQPAADGEPRPEAPIEPAVSVSELAAIRAELAALHTETARVNGILDKLHAENERLRRGETEQLLQPLFRDLIKLANDWNGMAASWATKDAATPHDVAKKCAEVADDAELILERNGVETYSPELEAPYERRCHRPIGTVPTDDAALHGTIAMVRRSGYRYGEKVLRYPEVQLYKLA